MAKPKKENDGKPKHPGGRPSKYTKELAEKICSAIACSTKSIRKICDENEEFPSHDTIHQWKIHNKEFSDLYMKAKANQADAFIEEIVEISDNSGFDKIIDENGCERLNGEAVARARLRVDTRKWIACKLMPKVYGDKSEVTTNIEDENIKAAIAEIRSAVDIIKSFERDY